MSRNREPLRDDAERVGHLISRRADDYAAMGDVERRTGLGRDSIAAKAAQVADEMAAADRDGHLPGERVGPCRPRRAPEHLPPRTEHQSMTIPLTTDQATRRLYPETLHLDPEMLPDALRKPAEQAVAAHQAARTAVLRARDLHHDRHDRHAREADDAAAAKAAPKAGKPFRDPGNTAADRLAEQRAATHREAIARRETWQQAGLAYQQAAKQWLAEHGHDGRGEACADLAQRLRDLADLAQRPTTRWRSPGTSPTASACGTTGVPAGAG